MNPRHVAIAIAALVGATGLVIAQQSVVDSVHNLSASGPGAVRASSEQEVCIFCHTSHNATPVQPLWNRRSPLNAYTVYSSTSLDADPGQPTGTSKMCLSCHDGTIALGSVVSRDTQIQMVGGVTTIPAGASNLGTDLSDDHPVSFRYSPSLVARDRNLRDPFALPEPVKLDSSGEMQCTSCHDPHDNSFDHFLVMSNTDSSLCISCHKISNTTIEAHSACDACHQSHTAPSGPLLLNATSATQTCISCHDGSIPEAGDILSDIKKYSSHDSTGDAPGPFGFESMHVDCADCHEPHTMDIGSGGPLSLPPNMGEISGVHRSGNTVGVASTEYEVCFKCHAEQNVANRSYVNRTITQINTRLEFDPTAASFHPLITPGRGELAPSLRPQWSTGSLVQCSDCHGSDTSRKAGGVGPNGVHGSNEPPLLVARYETTDFSPESTSAYALCYTCHRRDGPDGILSDRSFPHSVHVVDARAPCSVCHDAHGISSTQGNSINNSHLINFASAIVFPLNGEGPRFRDTGTFSGSCTLSCHGVSHVNTSYDER